MKEIILCADDYGQNTQISQAIVDLIKKNRLSAVSCLSSSPEWSLHAKALYPFKEQVEVGLHFNLTEGEPLSEQFKKKYGNPFFSLSKLILLAHLRRLDPKAIQAELIAQMDCFVAKMGNTPDFIDGHQHVHQLPIIRDVLIDFWQKYLKPKQVYFRATHEPFIIKKWNQPAFLKRLIIEFCGARAFKKALMDASIPHNAAFEGIYSFAKSHDYAELFPRFIRNLAPNGLIMCHPALKNNTHTDSIAKARYQEYRYFSSDQFLQECSALQVKLKNIFHRS